MLLKICLLGKKDIKKLIKLNVFTDYFMTRLVELMASLKNVVVFE